MFLVVTAVVTSVAARLASDVDLWWRPGGIFHLSATAVMLVLSGVLVNALPRVVTELWRWTGPFARGATRFVDAVRRPLRIAGVMVTVLVLGVGSYLLLPSSDRWEPGRISIMSAKDVGQDDPRTTLIEQWNKIHPDNQAEFVTAHGETDEQNERMVNDAKPDGDHQADIYVLDIVWMAQFVDNRYIRELDRSTLTNADLNDFVEKVLRTGRRHDKLWALPLNTDVGLIYYRTDSAAGITEPPTSWDALFGPDAAARAKAAGPGIAANAIQMSDEMGTVTLLEAIWAAEGNVVDQNGNVSLTTDENRVRFDKPDLAGLDALNEAIADPHVVPGTPRPEDMTSDAALDQFLKGRVLAMRNWAVAYKQLTDRQEELNKAGITFETAVPPTPSVLGGQNLAVSAHTDKPRAAQALIEFLTSAQSQLILSEIGGFAPTRGSVYDRPKGDAKDGHLDKVRDALATARPRPAVRHYTEFSQRFRNDIQEPPTDDWARELAEILRR
ncbi:extracellular solute-binding protein [Actinokineospora sp. 24-640]